MRDSKIALSEASIVTEVSGPRWFRADSGVAAFREPPAWALFVTWASGPHNIGIAAILLLAMLASGCATAPTTQPTTLDEKQDAILNDPMNYKPSMDHDITGGDITQFGKGLDKDLNDVLNP